MSRMVGFGCEASFADFCMACGSNQLAINVGNHEPVLASSSMSILPVRSQ